MLLSKSVPPLPFSLNKLSPELCLSIQLLSNITQLAWNTSWQSLLSNGTVNEPANNELTGTVYGLFQITLFFWKDELLIVVLQEIITLSRQEMS
jgi:hypothetical protein